MAIQSIAGVNAISPYGRSGNLSSDKVSSPQSATSTPSTSIPLNTNSRIQLLEQQEAEKKAVVKSDFVEAQQKNSVAFANQEEQQSNEAEAKLLQLQRVVQKESNQLNALVEREQSVAATTSFILLQQQENRQGLATVDQAQRAFQAALKLVDENQYQYTTAQNSLVEKNFVQDSLVNGLVNDSYAESASRLSELVRSDSFEQENAEKFNQQERLDISA